MIEDNPAMSALVKKLLEYQASGIEVLPEGLEAPSYNELEGE